MSKDMAFDHAEEHYDALERRMDMLQAQYEQSFNGKFEAFKQKLIDDPEEVWKLMINLIAPQVEIMSNHDIPDQDEHDTIMEARCKRVLDLIHDLTN